MKLPPILLSYVPESFILFLYKLFETQKEFNTSNITEGCLLTHNLIESIPSEYRQEIVKDFFPYDALFHLHIIKYPKGGELNYDYEEYVYLGKQNDPDLICDELNKNKTKSNKKINGKLKS